MKIISDIKLKREFLQFDFKIDTWENLKPYFDQLLNQTIQSVSELEKWLIKRSELESIVNEDMAWRYIHMNCDTTNESLSNAFEYFVSEIEPQIAPYSNLLNKKLIDSEFVNNLSVEKYGIYLRAIKRSIEMFREENIPLFVEISKLQQEYGKVCAAMTVEVNGQTLTLQRAAKFLEDNNRELRKEVYEKIAERRLHDKAILDELLNKLISYRQQVANNAGYANFRDYMHDELGRFDYSVQDCFDFHESIEEVLMPVMNDLSNERQSELNVSSLKPYDLAVDTSNQPSLKPFEYAQELTEKTIATFHQLDIYFAECIHTMNNMKHLDLESRIGKAPGGFLYPLMESGVPFIYMNSVGSQNDLITMVHEGGHAIHSFLCVQLELASFKNPPSEVAELASMSMELMSMDHWDTFFKNKDDYKRAKIDQLEKVLETLPWVATVDKFQHWMYENKNHTNQQRKDAWVKIVTDYNPTNLDFTGYQENLAYQWQKQLHIYEVPFYYIEYGMAQLGAIAVWRNYKTNPQKTIEQYKAALSLGYTVGIKDIYAAAGIKFDFSKAYVKELIDFVFDELKVLKNV
jgi:oligoendopeptidase F